MRPEAPLDDRLLNVARILGASFVGAQAVLGVDMPQGFLGSAGSTTEVGAAVVALQLLVGTVAAVGAGRGAAWSRWLAPLLMTLNLGLLVPAFSSDPLVAGAGILWQALGLGRQLFPSLPSERDLVAAERLAAGDSSWESRALVPAAAHMAFVALCSTIATIGFRVDANALSWAVCLLPQFVLLALVALPIRDALRRRERAPWLAIVPLLLAVACVQVPGLAFSMLALHQAATLAVLLSRVTLISELLRHFLEAPAQLLLGTFALLILLGSMLLTLPAASVDGRSIGFVDALFMSTSAVCVTGLAVIDPAVRLSFFGQAVLLGLVQVGGLGIMVLSSFAMLLIGGKLSIRGQRALGEVLEIPGARNAYELTRFIVLTTLQIEAVGALILGWRFAGMGLDPLDATWRAVFHAVSAFCNAGFALWSDNLAPLQSDPIALHTHSILITLGGLGFATMHALIAWARRPAKPRFSMQAQVVLATSAGLTLGGTLLYLTFESSRSLSPLGTLDRLSNAVFQSVTLRTAGFNSVDLTACAPVTVLLMIALMFVGASPGSTGGGIKTTTFAVLLGAFRALVRGEADVTMFSRRLSQDTVLRSASVALAALTAALVGLMLLLATQPIAFERLAFETFSALGTVGLSLGVTPMLDTFGKFVIMALMFLGRVGPVTVALLFGSSRPRRVRYPEARLMVG